MNIFDRIELLQGDITKLDVDCIVNAANNSLLGGGGVDGAIHRAAGSELLEECKVLNRCRTGEAKITKGYNLASKFIIHTVGSVWQDGNSNEDFLLESAYKNSLLLAKENSIKTIAFPSISTGVYNFPFVRACEIAISTAIDYLRSEALPNRVIFISFSVGDFEEYKQVFEKIKNDYINYLKQ